MILLLAIPVFVVAVFDVVAVFVVVVMEVSAARLRGRVVGIFSRGATTLAAVVWFVVIAVGDNKGFSDAAAGDTASSLSAIR